MEADSEHWDKLWEFSQKEGWVLYEQVGFWLGNSQRLLLWDCGSSWILNQHLGSRLGTDIGPLYLGNSCVTSSFVGPLRVGPGICHWCMSWHFGTYLLWWDALPILDVRGRSLVLPQLDISCLVNSHGRSYHFWMKTGGIDEGVEGKCGEETGGEEGEDTVCYIK